MSSSLSARNPSAFPGRQTILLLAIGLEIAIFAAVGTNFLTRQNAFEIARVSVELGLLALALTPIIVTGGIDLSVGALLALSAITLGKIWRDAHAPLALAIVAALFTGLLGGLFNGLLITRLRIPPLITTLGTFWLFRGLAEGLTGGMENYTRFPPAFLYLGQGYLAGIVPVQLPLLLLAALFFWLLLHRTIIGRAWVAIGYSPDGARHAGIPVDRRLILAYALSGLCAGIAAIIYVSHVGQAKADAGTNYELAAITAVVLGGTSISGGRGSIVGTLLGLFSIAILQNGLRLADLPTELAGVLTGVLLLIAIGLDHSARHGRQWPASPASETLKMRNTQLAMLCFVILLGAGIVAASNWWLARTVLCSAQTRADVASAPAAASPTNTSKRLAVAMMPKSKGNAYFIACRQGAEEAARKLNVDLIWDGPTETDPAKQNEVVETWITRGVDVLAVSVENREGLSTVLRKARAAGIKVLTWDADADSDARDFFINQATPEGIGYTLMDHAGRILGGKGEFAIITASLTAANQNEWRKHIEVRLRDKYPEIKLATVQPCDDQEKKAFEATQTILNAYPNVKLIMAICSPAVPGAAEAVKQSGRTDVKVIGLGLPNDNKRYVHEGITDSVVLWNTMDLGYLTIESARALHDGILKPGVKSLSAGRLGTVTVDKDNVMLGTPFTFDKTNIDKFDF